MEHNQNEPNTKVSEISITEFTRDVRQVLSQILFRLSEMESQSIEVGNELRHPLHIHFDGQCLRVQNTAIPLYTRPLSCRLISSFFRTKTAFVTRASLMQIVYELEEASSERLKKCSEINLNKLVSRTRHMIEDALVGTCWSGHMDWLVYDAESKSWQLFVVRAAPKFISDAANFPIIADHLPQIAENSKRL